MMPNWQLGFAKELFYNIRRSSHSSLIPVRIVPQVTDEIILDLINKQAHIETAARALKAMAHPLRLKILCVVGTGEACVQDIVNSVGTSQSNISQHLAILRDKEVLQTRKEANRVFYRVADPRLMQLIMLMREMFCGVGMNRRESDAKER